MVRPGQVGVGVMSVDVAAHQLGADAVGHLVREDGHHLRDQRSGDLPHDDFDVLVSLVAGIGREGGHSLGVDRADDVFDELFVHAVTSEWCADMTKAS